MANRIEIIIDSVTTGLESGLKKTEHGLGRFKFAALGAGIAVGGALAVGMEKSVHAAMEAEVAQKRLTQAYKTAHVAVGPLREQIEKLEAAGRKLGFTDEDTANSLGSLITATRNQKQAVKDLAVAQDLARFKGVSLNDATKMMTMAMTGSQRAAKQLGITVQPVTKTYDALKATMGKTIDAHEKLRLAQAKLRDKQLTGIAVVDAVRDHVKGQAKAFSDTASGAMQQFHAQIQHIEVAIGEKLLPVMTTALQWILKNWPAMSAAIQNAWTTQIKPPLDAMIGLVKTVVETIRAHWSTIGPIVKQVATIIETNVKVITNSLRLVTALLRGDWSGAWQAAKAIVMAEVNAIKAIVSLAAQAIVGAARGIGAGIKAGLKAGIAGVSGLVTAALGAIQHAIRVVAGDALGWAQEIGSRIVAGVISGLSSLAGAVGHAIHSGISAGIHVAGKALHGSGEFMFTKEAVGKPLMDGIVAGIRANPLSDALTGAVGTSAPRSGLALAGAAVGAGQGGAMIVNLILDGKVAARALIDPLRNEARILESRTGRPVFGS